MDVNAIGNTVNSIKIHSTSSDIYKNDSTIVEESLKVTNNTQDPNNKENQDIIDKKELDKAVKKLNKFLEDEKTHAEYSVHKDLGTLMIKIVDDDEKVVLELPPEKILNMVASMCKQVGLLDEKA